jgi:hypothetical protein
MTFVGAAGATGWQTLREIDFTAESSQDIDADTTYTIAGDTWTVANSSNASAMDVTNGTGIVVAATGGASRNYTSGQRNAPLLWCPIKDLFSSWSLVDHTAIRVLAQVSLANFETNEEFAKVGFESIPNASRQHWVVASGRTGGNQSAQSLTSVEGVAYTNSVTVSAPDALRVELTTSRVASYSYGTMSGSSFPESWVEIESTFAPFDSSGIVWREREDNVHTSAVAVVLVAQPSATSLNTFTVTIPQIQIEYLPRF